MEKWREELYHHGILGQRWGKRNGPPYPLGASDHSASEKKAGWRKSLDKTDLKNAKDSYREQQEKYTSNKIGYKELEKARQKVSWEKEKLQNKSVSGVGKEIKKGSRLDKYYQFYRKKGYTNQEAEIAARKRLKTEKILAISLGVTVAAVGAYVAYKHIAPNIDRIVPMGTQIQNISDRQWDSVRDSFYFSEHGLDNFKYDAMYGQQLKVAGNVWKTKMSTLTDIKVAGAKEAYNSFSELIKNDQEFKTYAKDLITQMQPGAANLKQKLLMNNAVKAIRSGNMDTKQVYEAFNFSIPLGKRWADLGLYPSAEKNLNKFYDSLKSRGYGGVIDLNDTKYSGYNSILPIIAFDGPQNFVIDSTREMGIGEVFGKALAKMSIDSAIFYATARLGSSVLTNLTTDQADTNQRDKIVRDYRRKHPNTELTRTEILDNYYS